MTREHQGTATGHEPQVFTMPILESIYLFTTAFLAVYGVQAFFLTLVARRVLPTSATPPIAWEHDTGLPSVTVQLPIYNERHVVRRLIDAVAAFDWPAEQLQIQVLDDSTDDTSQIIARHIAGHPQQELITHYRRVHRTDYKAGALREGLATAKGEFIAIFDADFVPPADFLQRTIPNFTDPTVGCVQARWGHLNANSSRLTQAQSLGINGHFVVEQTARDKLRALLNFNGTAGLWRRTCMDQAGGWQGDTLTEDLDLSYRAQLQGWRIVYRPDIIVPAEIPISVDAFKRQQFRWAKGSIQTAMKLLRTVFTSSHPLWRKLLGAIHLTSYSVHPLMILNLFFLLPMMSSLSTVLKVASLFSLTAIGPPLMYWTAMQAQGNEIGLSTQRHSSLNRPSGQTKGTVRQRMRQLTVLLALGTGLSVNNSRAVFEALLGIRSAFKRTPKFAITHTAKDWHTSTYVLPSDPTVWAEAALALYAVSLLLYSLLHGIWWLLPWLSLYAGGYTYIAYLSMRQAWEKRSTLRTTVANPSEEHG